MKRPFKVRWFSPHWNEYVGKSFAYKERALALAEKMFEEGCYDVDVWDAGNPNQFIYHKTDKDWPR